MKGDDREGEALCDNFGKTELQTTEAGRRQIDYDGASNSSQCQLILKNLKRHSTPM